MTYLLSEMLSQIPASNLHKETDWGEDVGQETLFSQPPLENTPMKDLKAQLIDLGHQKPDLKPELSRILQAMEKEAARIGLDIEVHVLKTSQGCTVELRGIHDVDRHSYTGNRMKADAAKAMGMSLSQLSSKIWDYPGYYQGMMKLRNAMPDMIGGLHGKSVIFIYHLDLKDCDSRAMADFLKSKGFRIHKVASQEKKANANQVAETILAQMGGKRRLSAYLGVQQLILLKSPDGVGIRWPNKKRSKGNYVKITLTPADLYDMEFQNVSTRGVKTVKTYRGLYADMLVETFERQTGWYLR